LHGIQSPLQPLKRHNTLRRLNLAALCAMPLARSLLQVLIAQSLRI